MFDLVAENECSYLSYRCNVPTGTVCHNGGSCYCHNDTARCYCFNGYSGESCEIKDTPGKYSK